MKKRMIGGGGSNCIKLLADIALFKLKLKLKARIGHPITKEQYDTCETYLKQMSKSPLSHTYTNKKEGDQKKMERKNFYEETMNKINIILVRCHMRPLDKSDKDNYINGVHTKNMPGFTITISAPSLISKETSLNASSLFLKSI